MGAKYGRYAAGVVLIGLLASCGGGSGGKNNAAGGKTTTTVKAAPLGKLTVAPIADFPNRTFRDAFGDGTALIVQSSNLAANGNTSTSLVRLNTAGAITKETQLGSSFVYGFVKTTAGTFAMGSFGSAGFGARDCGFRKIDPTALALGPIIKVSSNGSCSGGSNMDRGVDGAVVWTANTESDALVRTDTAAGKVTSVSLKDALPAGYDMGSAPIAVDGDVFVDLTARYDSTTRKPVTDANGKPLPRQVAKVDGASSKVTVKELPGFLNVTDGRMIVVATAANNVGPATYFELDPKTLELKEITQADLTKGQGANPVEGDGVSWSVVQTGNTTMRVTQRDPQQGNRTVAEGTLDTGLPSVGGTTAVAIGKDVYIVVGSSTYDQATRKSKAASKLFKTSAA